MHGHHQVSHACNAKLDDTLMSVGFWRTPMENAIYFRWNDNVWLVVGVYINDLIIIDTDHDDINSFKKEMAVVFKTRDLGLLHYYLKIEVK
jgi:hypothetical protein